MKILLVEFHQETNSFNPITTNYDYFKQNRIYEGEQIIQNLIDKPCVLSGMIHAINEKGSQVIPGYSMFTMSGGPVEHSVVVHFLNKVATMIKKFPDIDGVFVSLHGATQTTQIDDCSGYILESIRTMIGEEKIISTSTDMHANITNKMVKNSDIICGYQTYPHKDHFETGYRTAVLGLKCLNSKIVPKMVKVDIPMIVPASTYNTMNGPFSELINEAKKLQEEGAFLDFSIYQMQPWLDVKEGSSSVVVIDYDQNNAKEYALKLANRLFAIKDKFKPKLHSIDEVIDIAAENNTSEPVILVDSADSSNAGATGDSIAVIERLIERNLTDLKTAAVVVDADAADRAHRIGVGKKATFRIGGSLHPEINEKIEVEAYIKSLHDGIFFQEGPAGKGIKNNNGPSAVLQINNITLLVAHHIFGNGDPQLYRSAGIEPTFYKLVLVKSCTSFRAAYSSFSSKIYETDTPGAARVNLESLPFKKLSKENFYPFNNVDNYTIENVIYGRNV